jgi:hypothetical protein
MNISAIAAIIYAMATAGVVVFQVGLALGAPWGGYAMGGAFPGRFPPHLRIAAVAQAAILAMLAVVVLATAGLLAPKLVQAAPWLVWLAVAFSAVAAILNTITRNVGERRLWAPVTYVMLACSLIVALMAS